MNESKTSFTTNTTLEVYRVLPSTHRTQNQGRTMSQQKYDDKVLDESRLKNVEQRSEKVDQLLRQNQYVDALQTALENPPVGSKTRRSKRRMQM